MNYGGGGMIATSGETWVLSNVVSQILKGIASPVVFDVGANVGDYSLLVKQCMPSATVHAFEPARTTYEELVRRVKEAGSDVKAHNIGFSDSRKTVDLFSYAVEGKPTTILSSIDQRLPTAVQEVRTNATEPIEVNTIDDFCEVEGIDHINFLKIDVEGHELSILRGAQRMLAKGAVSMIQFEFGPGNIYSRTFFFDFWSLLSSFTIYRILPTGIAPIRYYGEHREIFLTTNYLAIKE
jgi:FkbM family methyltransferase